MYVCMYESLPRFNPSRSIPWATGILRSKIRHELNALARCLFRARLLFFHSLFQAPLVGLTDQSLMYNFFTFCCGAPCKTPGQLDDKYRIHTYVKLPQIHTYTPHPRVVYRTPSTNPASLTSL